MKRLPVTESRTIPGGEMTLDVSAELSRYPIAPLPVIVVTTPVARTIFLTRLLPESST